MNWREHFRELVISTPTVQLRVATDPELEALGHVAANHIGVYPSGMSPFRARWDTLTPERRAAHIVDRQRSAWDTLSIDMWRVSLTVFKDNLPIGEVTLRSTDFRDNKTFSTATWLAEHSRDQGIGTQVRLAALQFGFGTLAADMALTRTFANNAQSLAINKKLRYELSGATMHITKGAPARRVLMYRLNRRSWEARLRNPNIIISGMCIHFP